MGDHIRKKRKEDALALAELIYDIFIEETSGSMLLGQKDAKPKKDH